MKSATRMRFGLMFLLALSMFVVAVNSANAQQSTGASFFDKMQFSGFVDGYYGYNFNRPPSRNNALRNFDFHHNQFNLNLFEIAIQQDPQPLGFRVDLNLGETAKWVHSTEPGGSDVYQYLQQAYFSIKPPSGHGFQLDFGKFVTQHGAEVIETKDNWNYSRSLLFAWAIPYYHFGVRATLVSGDKGSFLVSVNNGWNNVVDNNADKTVGLQGIVKPRSNVTFVQNYMVGKEQAGPDGPTRHLWDSTLTVDANSVVSLMANYDYGMDRSGGARVKWQGLAAYTRFTVTPVIKLVPRYEWFQDKDGFETGKSQTLHEGTMTLEYLAKESLIVRAEYRHDWSSARYFEHRNEPLSHAQDTAMLGLVYLLGK